MHIQIFTKRNPFAFAKPPLFKIQGLLADSVLHFPVPRDVSCLQLTGAQAVVGRDYLRDYLVSCPWGEESCKVKY